MLNFTNILQGFKDFANSEEPLDILLTAVNETKAEFENRVFNSETGTKTKTGSNIQSPYKSKESPYSAGYAKYRRSIGRQTKVVDLELTGSLRRSTQVIRTEDSVKMAYLSKAEIEKIVKLEKHFREPIFSLSEEEEKLVNKKAIQLFGKAFKNIVENGGNNK